MIPKKGGDESIHRTSPILILVKEKVSSLLRDVSDLSSGKGPFTRKQYLYTDTHKEFPTRREDDLGVLPEESLSDTLRPGQGQTFLGGFIHLEG